MFFMCGPSCKTSFCVRFFFVVVVEIFNFFVCFFYLLFILPTIYRHNTNMKTIMKMNLDKTDNNNNNQKTIGEDDDEEEGDNQRFVENDSILVYERDTFRWIANDDVTGSLLRPDYRKICVDLLSDHTIERHIVRNRRAVKRLAICAYFSAAKIRSLTQAFDASNRASFFDRSNYHDKSLQNYDNYFSNLREFHLFFYGNEYCEDDDRWNRCDAFACCLWATFIARCFDFSAAESSNASFGRLRHITLHHTFAHTYAHEDCAAICAQNFAPSYSLESFYFGLPALSAKCVFRLLNSFPRIRRVTLHSLREDDDDEEDAKREGKWLDYFDYDSPKQIGDNVQQYFSLTLLNIEFRSVAKFFNFLTKFGAIHRIISFSPSASSSSCSSFQMDLDLYFKHLSIQNGDEDNVRFRPNYDRSNAFILNHFQPSTFVFLSPQPPFPSPPLSPLL